MKLKTKSGKIDGRSVRTDFSRRSGGFPKGGTWRKNKGKYLNFQQAKDWCANNMVYERSTYLKKRTKKLPINPMSFYWRDWKGWRNFCNVEFITYDEAKLVSRFIKIKTRREYNDYQKGFIRLPSEPSSFYKEWKGWDNFLNCKDLPTVPTKKVFINFKEAKRIVQKIGIKSSKEFRKLAKIRPELKNIPVFPEEHYKRVVKQ